MTKVQQVAEKYGIKLVNGKATPEQYAKWTAQALIAQIVMMVGVPYIALGWLVMLAPGFDLIGLAIWFASPFLTLWAIFKLCKLRTIKAAFQQAEEYDYYYGE